MSVLGRIIGLLGWAWIVLALLAPLADLGRVNFLPAIIFLFVGRALRRRGKKTQDDQAPAAEPERMLNTERERAEPAITFPPIPAPAETLPAVGSRPAGDGLLDRLLAADSHDESNGDEDVVPLIVQFDEPTSPEPISSAEMIARARARWGTRP